ncbi:hypothetical protein LGQ02_15100 [Bacillus shivajii]|uniref:hypothetical protein n=1 Tax=Bacillus shivajii TaxID=1983719 RepID=UPI001CFB3CC0|nr:hypothetical protein [Bacillus shivajii]UCZ52162.1 hypothetical protein LGQ02_15100 [Bacillus shivajii]
MIDILYQLFSFAFIFGIIYLLVVLIKRNKTNKHRLENLEKKVVVINEKLDKNNH